MRRRSLSLETTRFALTERINKAESQRLEQRLQSLDASTHKDMVRLLKHRLNVRDALARLQREEGDRCLDEGAFLRQDHHRGDGTVDAGHSEIETLGPRRRSKSWEGNRSESTTKADHLAQKVLESKSNDYEDCLKNLASASMDSDPETPTPDTQVREDLPWPNFTKHDFPKSDPVRSHRCSENAVCVTRRRHIWLLPKDSHKPTFRSVRPKRYTVKDDFTDFKSTEVHDKYDTSAKKHFGLTSQDSFMTAHSKTKVLSPRRFARNQDTAIWQFQDSPVVTTQKRDRSRSVTIPVRDHGIILSSLGSTNTTYQAEKYRNRTMSAVSHSEFTKRASKLQPRFSDAGEPSTLDGEQGLFPPRPYTAGGASKLHRALAITAQNLDTRVQEFLSRPLPGEED